MRAGADCVTDFLSDLRRVTALLHDSPEVRELNRILSSAWTSSSEMLGEIGLAIRRIEKTDSDLPSEVQACFAGAIAEIRKVWPEI